MKHKLLAITLGVGLLTAGFQVAAQISYNGDDLLVNFRDTADVTGLDLEVDLGPISTLQAFQGTEMLVSSNLVEGVYGAPNESTPIGMSATAGDDTSGTLWLSRVDSTPGTPPSAVSGQQAQSEQFLTGAAIDNIGADATAGAPDGSGAATVTGATSGFSYQAQGEENTSTLGQTAINFGSTQNINASKGGAIEIVQSGAGAVYAALWEVPPTGSGSDTYLGFLTFQTDGEVDYTSAGTVVVQPRPYLSIVATGPTSVLVLWTNSGSYTLQQNTNIASASGWTTSPYPVSSLNGTSSITISPATGNLFFRLLSQ
jgi:hypothetical protein